MRPDKTQSSIDALRILANAINNKSGIHIKRNGDIRENRFYEKILNYLGIKTTPKNWEISAKNRVIEKISADLKLLKKDTTIEGKLISNEQINEFVENYFRNVKSEAISKPIFDKIFQNINNDLLSLSKEIHGENTANFRASLALPGVSTAAAVQISMFANDLKKRWGLNSGQALTAGFQVWHLCKNNVDLNPEAAFHVVLTARKLEKKHILKPPKSHEELKINLDAAAEIVQTALALKKSHNSPYPLAHACQRYIAIEQLALALPLGMKPNLIEGNPIKKRYEIPETLRNEFSTSMKKFKITAAETNTALGVTKQFHRECIGNPFEFTFPSLAENAEASSSICITHSGLEKKSRIKGKTGRSLIQNHQFPQLKIDNLMFKTL